MLASRVENADDMVVDDSGVARPDKRVNAGGPEAERQRAADNDLRRLGSAASSQSVNRLFSGEDGKK